MKKGFMFKSLRVVIVISAAFIIAGLLFILRPKAQRQVTVEKGRLVETMTVKAENINMTIEAYGTVKPGQYVITGKDTQGGGNQGIAYQDIRSLVEAER